MTKEAARPANPTGREYAASQHRAGDAKRDGLNAAFNVLVVCFSLAGLAFRGFYDPIKIDRYLCR